jgi:quercetin dioxygenase-like cupin family protein
MSRAADATQRHKAREVEHGKLEGVAYVPPGEGTRSLWLLGELLTHKVPSRQTGGAYALFEATTQPGAGPPPHVHHREDEIFYVLEGAYEFLVDGHTMKAEAGSILYVPKGTLHAHENVGDEVGRMLLTQTPGGLYELFVEKAGRPADGDDGEPPTSEDLPEVTRRIVEVATEHGTEIPPCLRDHPWRPPAGQSRASSPSTRTC